jgi:hypothetical protein
MLTLRTALPSVLLWISLLSGCGAREKPAPNVPVAAASPPKDDGGAARGGAGGDDHSAALEQLKMSPLGRKTDREQTLRVSLPDAEHWTRVRFLTVKSLVAFRYGKEHHAIFAGFVSHVRDNTEQGACTKSMEQWATPYIEAFEVELAHGSPAAFAWSPLADVRVPASKPRGPKAIEIVEVDVLRANVATVLLRENYEAAWAAYPAWGRSACLALGIAVPIRNDPERARIVRDRFVQEVFPNVELSGSTEPTDRR